MQIDEIGKLMEFMKANDLNVLELEEGGSRLLLERHMPTVGIGIGCFTASRCCLQIHWIRRKNPVN